MHRPSSQTTRSDSIRVHWTRLDSIHSTIRTAGAEMQCLVTIEYCETSTIPPIVSPSWHLTLETTLARDYTTTSNMQTNTQGWIPLQKAECIDFRAPYKFNSNEVPDPQTRRKTLCMHSNPPPIDSLTLELRNGLDARDRRGCAVGMNVERYVKNAFVVV
jgi:hypothetical protein